MPTFDPSKPAASSLISSGELRDQLNALNDQITTVSGQLSDLSSDVLPQLTAVGSLTPLTAPFSNPPTTADLEAIRTKLNAIISALTI